MESGSSFLHDALPFVIGLGYIAITPLLDSLIWRTKYVSFYEAKDIEVAPEDLAKGAAWAVDLAQVVPGALFTVVGILLAVEHVTAPAAVAAAVSLLLPFCLVAYLQRRGNLQLPEADPHVWVYSLPQLAIAVADAIGILILAM